VATQVRVLFSRRRIPARDVAKALGWTDNYISRRLRGETPFGLNDLHMMADLLEIPLTSFFPEMILEGGRLSMGSNKQYYLTPPPVLNPYPTWDFDPRKRPLSVDISLAA